MAGTSLSAPHPTIANLWPVVTDSINSNHILFGYCNGSPDTTAGVYAHGCILNQRDSGTGSKALWENIGSSAVPSWNLLGQITAGEIGAGVVTGANQTSLARYMSVATNTNGTTPVNIFGTGGSPTGMTLTSVMSINKDATAGNIIVKQAANTVSNHPKSTTLTWVAGATLIANNTYAAADVATVESSTSGNATVITTWYTVN